MNQTDKDDITDLPPLEALEKTSQIVLMTLYSMTAIVSFVSNSTVILVLVFGKKSSKELKKFLINLAIADMCMASFSIPFTYTDFMLGRWIFPSFLCQFAQFIAICALSVSVHTLTAIGFERYIAIKYPLRRSSCFGTYGNLMIIMIWMFGIIISLPQLLASRVVPFKYGNNNYVDCRDEWDDYDNEKLFLFLVFLVTFALPTAILIFTYGSIAVALKNQSTPGNSDNIRDRAIFNNKVKAVKMMTAVVIMFILCWLPIQAFNMIIFNEWYTAIVDFETFKNIYVHLFFGCHFLAMAHSMVNPFIYCFMSNNFMYDLKRATTYLCQSISHLCWICSTITSVNLSRRPTRTTIDNIEIYNIDTF